MSEKFTPDTLRALVAHGKGTPAEYIVKRADIDAHADAWQAREEALRRLALRDWTSLDEHELNEVIAEEIAAEATTGTVLAELLKEHPADPPSDNGS